MLCFACTPRLFANFTDCGRRIPVNCWREDMCRGCRLITVDAFRFSAAPALQEDAAVGAKADNTNNADAKYGRFGYRRQICCSAEIASWRCHIPSWKRRGSGQREAVPHLP